MTVTMVARSDKGRVRSRNEDSFAINEKLGYCVVADGMGGQKGGCIASSIATQIINSQLECHCNIREQTRVLQRQRTEPAKTAVATAEPAKAVKTEPDTKVIKRAVEKANTEILERSRIEAEFADMGTTVVVGVFAEHKLYYGHVGDSRIYLLRNSRMMQLTTDHSWVQEMYARNLIRKNQLKSHRFSSLITRALGMQKLSVDVGEMPVEDGDIVVFCTDGLSDYVDESEIRRIILESESLAYAADSLITLANERGGFDNVTVTLVGC